MNATVNACKVCGITEGNCLCSQAITVAAPSEEDSRAARRAEAFVPGETTQDWIDREAAELADSIRGNLKVHGLEGDELEGALRCCMIFIRDWAKERKSAPEKLTDPTKLNRGNENHA